MVVECGKSFYFHYGPGEGSGLNRVVNNLAAITRGDIKGNGYEDGSYDVTVTCTAAIVQGTRHGICAAEALGEECKIK